MAFRLNAWRELALFCLILMEGIWAALLVSLVVQVQREISLDRAFACLVLISLAAHISTRALLALRLRLSYRRLAAVLLIGVSVWVGFAVLAGYPPTAGLKSIFQGLNESISGGRVLPGEFLLVFAILVLWLRGLSLARDPVGAQIVLGSFQFGMLAWFLFGMASPMIASPGTAPFFLAYLLSGLLGMAAGRLYEISDLRGGRKIRFSRAWIAAVIGAILLLGALGLAASILVQGPLGNLLRLLVWIMVALVAGVMSIVLLLMFAVVVELAPWLSERLRLQELLLGFEQIAQRLRDAVQPILASVLLQRIVEVMWTGRLVLFAALLLFLVGLAVSWLRFQRRAERERENEDEDLPLTLPDALGLLRRVLRISALRALDSLRQRLGLANARRLLAAARVRWIYARLMSLSARMGTPRPQAVTPLEFLPALGSLFPGFESDLNLITQAYLRVRYGEQPETPEETHNLLAAWSRIKKSPRST